jgi:glycosyltransferase involved in cell wall biosynthesis
VTAASPLVTVIIPGRDIAGFVPDALDSLRSQTEQRWAAILVDDGSQDDTGAIFRAAAAEDQRFRFVAHEASRGLGAARNVALDLVDTTLVGFLDGDDELTPTAIERLTRTLAESGSDFVAGAYVRTRFDGERYMPGRVQPWVSAATDPERLGTTIHEHPHACSNIVAWSKISRTELWNDLRFPEGVAYEDQLVAQTMYTRARAFDVIPDVVVRWRLRADGTSITQGKAQLPVLRDYLGALRGGIRILHEAGATDAVVARLDLILAMDLPSLIEIAGTHPDPEYAEVVSSFVAELESLPEYDRVRPDPTITAALAW